MGDDMGLGSVTDRLSFKVVSDLKRQSELYYVVEQKTITNETQTDVITH